MISGWRAQRARSAKMAAAMMLRGIAVSSSWAIASAPLCELEHAARGFLHRRADDLFFVRLEGGEDMVGDAAPPLRPAHAHLHAPDVLGAQRVDHRAHAVVPARATLDAHPYRAEGEVDVVVHENEIARLRVYAAQGRRHRGAAHVHEGQGLDEMQRIAAPRSVSDHRLSVAPPRLLQLRGE